MKKMTSIMMMVLMMVMFVGVTPTSAAVVDPPLVPYAPPTVVQLNTVVAKEYPVLNYTERIFDYLGKPKAEVLKVIETKTKTAYLEIEQDKKTYRLLDNQKEFIGWIYFENNVMVACYVYEAYTDQPASTITGSTDLRYLQTKWADARIPVLKFSGAKRDYNEWDGGFVESIKYLNKAGNVYEVNFINTYDKEVDMEYACLELIGYLNQASYDLVPKGR